MREEDRGDTVFSFLCKAKGEKMNLRQKIYRICGKPKPYFTRSSPTLLCCLATAGVIGTAIASARATPKAMKLLKEAADEKGEELSRVEKLVAVSPAYIPSAMIGLGTIFCIFGANILNKRHQASLMSAYLLLKSYHEKYRNKLIELHGKEADVEIRNAMIRERCDFHPIDCDVPEGKVIFYDEISGESVMRYEREVIDAEYHFNRNFTMRGYAFLNEFYEFLGLPATEYGGVVGWSMASGIMWVDFEHRIIDKDDGGGACYSIDMIFSPEVLEEWEC